MRADLAAVPEIIDFHTHVGRDVDGSFGTVSELQESTTRLGVDRLVTFPFDEPDASDGFRAANDRLLAATGAVPDSLVPFCRVDARLDPTAEARRALGRGARGVKLHPRAQEVELGDRGVLGVVELAAEHDVPLVVHAGRGLPPIAEHVAALAAAVPEARIVLAHSGIADLAALAGAVAEVPNVFFDTSVWSPADLAACLAAVPPGRVAYGSDYPYGVQPAALLLVLRVARVCGLDQADIAALLGGNAQRLFGEAADSGPARGEPEAVVRQPVHWVRAGHWLAMATTSLWTRSPDVLGALELATRAVAADPGADADAFREIGSALAPLWQAAAADGWPRDAYRETMALMHLAAVIAGTAQ